MADAVFPPDPKRPLLVGSFGSPTDLKNANAETIRPFCDLAEIRLDLLAGEPGVVDPELWRHLDTLPILFTARRQDEGGARPLDAPQRTALLWNVLDRAACIDVEVASIPEMEDLLGEAKERGIPWIASFHNFQKLPPNPALEHAATLARDAGASVFKVAARLQSPADLARLADFQRTDRGLPVASMGMGPLATVSRLLCAQCGSVLNYGFIGSAPTAPGQWNARQLKEAIENLPPFRPDQP